MLGRPTLTAVTVEALQVGEMMASSSVIWGDEEDNEVKHCHQSKALVELGEWD